MPQMQWLGWQPQSRSPGLLPQALGVYLDHRKRKSEAKIRESEFTRTQAQRESEFTRSLALDEKQFAQSKMESEARIKTSEARNELVETQTGDIITDNLLAKTRFEAEQKALEADRAERALLLGMEVAQKEGKVFGVNLTPEQRALLDKMAASGAERIGREIDDAKQESRRLRLAADVVAHQLKDLEEGKLTPSQAAELLFNFGLSLPPGSLKEHIFTKAASLAGLSPERGGEFGAIVGQQPAISDAEEGVAEFLPIEGRYVADPPEKIAGETSWFWWDADFASTDKVKTVWSMLGTVIEGNELGRIGALGRHKAHNITVINSYLDKNITEEQYDDLIQEMYPDASAKVKPYMAKVSPSQLGRLGRLPNNLEKSVRGDQSDRLQADVGKPGAKSKSKSKSTPTEESAGDFLEKETKPLGSPIRSPRGDRKRESKYGAPPEGMSQENWDALNARADESYERRAKAHLRGRR